MSRRFWESGGDEKQTARAADDSTVRAAYFVCALGGDVLYWRKRRLPEEENGYWRD